MNRIVKTTRSLVRKALFTSRISGGANAACGPTEIASGSPIRFSKYRAGFIALCFAIAFLAPVAQAQHDDSIAEINVPFAFECGSQHYPAGVYNIRKWGQDLLLISGSSRSGFVLMQTKSNVRRAEKGKAVFRVTGNRHFLHAVWNAGSSTHVVFFPSSAEQEIESASNGIHQPDIQLALLDAPR